MGFWVKNGGCWVGLYGLGGIGKNKTSKKWKKVEKSVPIGQGSCKKVGRLGGKNCQKVSRFARSARV